MIGHNKFPSELVSNETKKTFGFAKDFASAIWSEHGTKYSKLKAQYELNRQYATGTHSVQRAKSKMMRKFIKQEHYLIDWENRIKIFPRLLQNYYNSVDMTEFTPIVRAIDPTALEVRQERKNEKLKLLFAKDFIKKNAEMAGGESPIPLSDVPESKEQIELQEQTAKPLRVERGEEKVIQYITTESDFKTIQKQVLRDAVELNIMVGKVETDPVEGIKMRYVDPENFIYKQGNKPFHSDDNYFGEAGTITIAEFKNITRASGLSYTDDDIKKIAKIGQFDKFDESVKINVLFYSFKTFFQNDFKKKINRETNKISLIPREFGTEDEYNPRASSDKSEKVSDNYDVWFEGILCTDSGEIIKHELVKNMPEYKGKIMPPYIVATPRKVSFVEENISLIDSIDELRWRIIHHRNTLKGIMTEIDPDTLASLKFGNEEITPQDALSLYFTQYLSFKRTRDEDGELINGGRAVTEIPTSIPQSLIALMEQFLNEIQMLQQAFGAYQLEQQKPDPKSNGELEQYRLSENTAMRDYTDFLFHWSLLNMQTVSARISDAFEWKHIKQKFMDNIGIEDVEALEQYRNDRKYHSFSLNLDYVPTKTERAMMIQNIGAYVESGMLDPLDAMEITSIKNIRTAMATMRLRLQDKESKSKEFELQKLRENQNINITTTQVANEEKRKTMEMEYELRAQEKAIEFEREAFLLQKTGEIKIQEVSLREQNKTAVEEFRNNFNLELTAFKKEQDGKIRREAIDQSAKKQEQLIKLRKGEISSIDEDEPQNVNVDLRNF